MVDGLHPSGTPLHWHGGRSPANVSIDSLPTVDKACTDKFLDACAVVLGAGVTQQTNGRSGPSAPCELTAGIESSRWFDELEQDTKLSALRYGLDVMHEVGLNLPRQAGGPGYGKWIRIGMALARTGIVAAEDLWVEWNQRVAGADDEEHLRRQFASFGTDGRITIGTFIKIAAECGADFSSYKSQSKSASPHHLSAAGWPEVDRRGKPKPGYRNAKIAASALGIVFKHDTFHGRKTIGGHAIGRFAGEITEDAFCALRDLIVSQFGFDCGKEHLADAANALCIENSHDPVCAWLDSLQWDSQIRLDTWLIDHAGVIDCPLNRAIGALLLVAMVRRARQPGCKFDNIIVLEGPQGCGKSSLVLALADAPEHFTDAPLLGNDVKTVAEALRGKWVAEISELAGLRRSEVEDVKAFISRVDDRARPAYGRYVESHPRTCVFVGTTNSEEYLSDDTGNRRFIPVRVGSIDLCGFRQNREQLFAEAVLRERGYGPLELPQTVWGAAASEANERRLPDPWVERLRDKLNPTSPLPAGLSTVEALITPETLPTGEKRIRTTAVELLLGLDPLHCNTGTARRLTTVMKDLGWKPHRWRPEGSSPKVRGFLKDP